MMSLLTVPTPHIRTAGRSGVMASCRFESDFRPMSLGFGGDIGLTCVMSHRIKPPGETMPNATYDQIADYINESDLPRKPQKLAGLAVCRHRRIPMRLLPAAGPEDATILVDGIAIDPSELENGHWL